MSKEENRVVLDLAGKFLTAVMKREDWHPYAQLRTRKMKTPPNIPTFSDFRVVKTAHPGKGIDPEFSRTVQIEITLGGNEQLKLQAVSAKLLATKEVGWDVCPRCNGEGATDNEEVCSMCKASGKVTLDIPRIPEKGSDTFEHDVENSEWGICPTSFQFTLGMRRLVEPGPQGSNKR